MISIEKFNDRDAEDVVKLVLHFQNDGTRPFVTVNDQPDLLNITKDYIEAGGYFWVAKDDKKLVGSIGLMPCSDNIYILKKFFVYENYQGTPYHLGQKLYVKLLEFAKSKKIKKILLDTPKNTTRAHKFYTKAGFVKVTKNELPITFNHPYKDCDCDFFLLDLSFK